ncbi:hypothetical protein ILUMI_15040 [Ignelater luminosus]|uniref:DUF5641 domain-containing protein n=1 Tax=Ignelater luminosus TaxID=2038154 RepID=A0A8K0GAC1_IGNLU|nr:hypothetical protein ILUMI_15040 [Ignelater luminosus]
MFLREQAEVGMPDCDEIDKRSFSRNIRNQQRLRDNLRQRFRLEYLGQLKLLFRSRNSDPPIGRVVELIPGKDGRTRLVRVKTKRGQLLRPVQRLFPLECNGEVSSEMVQEESARANVSVRSDKSRAPVQKVSVTCSGRVLKVPKKLID